MGRGAKKIICGILATVIMGSCISCSVDKGAMNVVTSYANALISRDRAVLNANTLPGTDTSCFDICSDGTYKDKAVDLILQRTTVKVVNDESSAKKKDGTGSLVCVFTMPDYETVLSSSPSSLTEFASMLDNAGEKEIRITFELIYQNDEWYVTDPSVLSEALYTPLYVPRYPFVMQFEEEIVNVDFVDSENDVYTDSNKLQAVFTMSDDFTGSGLFDSLTYDLYRGNDIIYSGPCINGENDEIRCTAYIMSTDLSEYPVFPKDTYSFVIKSGDDELFMADVSEDLTDSYFPDKSIILTEYWLNEDAYGGYYNVDSFTTVVALDQYYLGSGKDYELTYLAWGPDGQMSEEAEPSYEGTNAICSFQADEQLPTGTYYIIVYNNGTQILTESVNVVDNLNPNDFTELDVPVVSDPEVEEGQPADKVLVYSNGRSNIDLLNSYTDVEFEYVNPSLNLYEHELDAVLASGDGAPDIFFCDSSYVSKYANSEYTLPINDIGISYSELRYMYPYTFRMPTDSDNVIRGVTWQITPGAVFYNRSVAQTYLGLSDPEYVQSFFATWDDVLETGRTLNEVSGGTVKLIAGYTEIESAYFNGRTDPWIVDGDITLPDYMYDYLGFLKALKTEEMTFEAGRWGTDWNSHITDNKVLSYWGSMWLGEYFLSSTYGSHYGLVEGPTNYYEGGNWIFVSEYCDMPASSAEIIRDMTMNQSTLLDMADNGTLVNNIIIMDNCANDPEYCVDWLDGQNPYSLFADKALALTGEGMSAYDNEINSEFISVANGYMIGLGIVRTEELAEEQFLENVSDSGILG
ncbi:MAG: extracellular solute-binding protein [Clostridiales bacterium]|nr:extracellular solute-binding protein [Clostridiales bacterium]